MEILVGSSHNLVTPFTVPCEDYGDCGVQDICACFFYCGCYSACGLDNVCGCKGGMCNCNAINSI